MKWLLVILAALYGLSACTEQQRKPTRQERGHSFIPDPSTLKGD